MNEVKIYPQFIGRLGNNLFQIAAAIGYAEKHNVGWGIRKGYTNNGFNADQVDRFFPHLPEFNGTFRGYNEPNFFYEEIPFHDQGVRIVGFWQSLKYFKHAQDQVKKWIRVPISPGYKDYVSIHVRRGDYVQHSGSFPPVTYEYIYEAYRHIINYIQGTPIPNIEPRRCKLMIFSDDIQWCKENLNYNNQEIYFSEGRNEFEDLALMASCGHHIISNSTLAWWGAFLGHNPNKVVVSPHHLNWFGPENPHRNNTYDLLPEEWVQIKFR